MNEVKSRNYFCKEWNRRKDVRSFSLMVRFIPLVLYAINAPSSFRKVPRRRLFLSFVSPDQ